MKIEVDNNSKQLIYVDKDNLQVANTNEIIKLKMFNTSISNTYANIIAGCYNLNKKEKDTLRYILDNEDCKYKSVINALVRQFTVASITVERCIKTLIELGLVYISYNAKGATVIKTSSAIKTALSNKTCIVVIPYTNI